VTPNSKWVLSTGRVAGTGHRDKGTPCQDDVRYRFLGGNGFVAAVSDGAGSGRLSHWGSGIAVRSLTYSLAKLLESGTPVTSEIITSSVSTAIADIHRLEERCRLVGMQVLTQDFACTCIVTVLQSDRLIVAQIGDGAVVANFNGQLNCLSAAPDREYVNETTFMTSARAMEELHVREEQIANLLGLAIMTDGVQHLAIRYPANEPYDRFFQPLFDHAVRNTQLPEAERDRELTEFLDTPVINAETDDDKTLLIAVPFCRAGYKRS
jgi:hypothetical protein